MQDPFEAEALSHLRALTGNLRACFREGQLDAIRAAVEERSRVVVVQRTGWGKSAVYFVATKMLRDRGLGPTLLLSPLLALMQNQVVAAERMGLRARVVNSTNPDAWDQVRNELAANRVDLLLVSEMRLANDKFRTDFLPHVGERAGLLVVDEVHCISDWGHDFRPNYRRIGRVLQRLPSSTPVIGCTATANDRVVADVEGQFGHNLTTVRGSLARDGLQLEVHTDKRRPAARIAWLTENIPRLPGSGIIYCLTRSSVFRVADFLESHGIECGRYVGGGNPEEVIAKETDLDRFLTNDLHCMVATSALGMGYDKPDVGWVVHYQMPQSAIAYYQQVGRAGRALDQSYGILLLGTEDRNIQDWFIDQAFPSPEEVNWILTELEAADEGLTRGQIAARTNLSTKRIDNLMVQLDVEGAVERAGTRWYRTLAPWHYPHSRIEAVTEWRRREQAAMEDYIRSNECRMVFLRRQLDDTLVGSCGVCDVCRGEQFGQEPPGSLIDEAERFLRYSYVHVEPRKQWPLGTEFAGRINAGVQLEQGWCLTPWGADGWGPKVRAGKQDDSYFSDELLDPVAEMIRSHADPLPSWLTFVPSDRHPTLVPDFARRLGENLGIPVLDVIRKTRDTEPQKLMMNSARQHQNVSSAFSIQGDVPDTPGVLFDDIIDSRWTVTVIGALLREKGSGPIVPIGLASAAGVG